MSALRGSCARLKKLRVFSKITPRRPLQRRFVKKTFTLHFFEISEHTVECNFNCCSNAVDDVQEL